VANQREAKRQESRGVIERQFAEFLITGNPMCACIAYLEARSIGDPLPDWVIGWMDKGMSQFWRSFQAYHHGSASARPDQNRNHPIEAFAEAFGVYRKQRPGRGTIWTEFGAKKYLAVGLDVCQTLSFWARSGQAIKETEAVKEFCRKQNQRRSDRQVSYSDAWRAWARWKRRHPDYMPKLRQSAEERRTRIKGGQIP
jgi:hypothetical protein